MSHGNRNDTAFGAKNIKKSFHPSMRTTNSNTSWERNHRTNSLASNVNESKSNQQRLKYSERKNFSCKFDNSDNHRSSNNTRSSYNSKNKSQNVSQASNNSSSNYLREDNERESRSNNNESSHQFEAKRSYKSRNDNSNSCASSLPSNEMIKSQIFYNSSFKKDNEGAACSNYEITDEETVYQFKGSLNSKSKSDNRSNMKTPLPSNEMVELSKMVERSVELNSSKYNDIPVSIKGDNVPDHINSFDEVKLTRIIREKIDSVGYTVPTLVQRYSIPFVLANRDVMICAQTGSGKTAAYLIPILNTIFEQGLPSTSNPNARRYNDCQQKPLGLVLAPTRELATQIFEESKKFTNRARVRPCVVYGGHNIDEQIRDLEHGCQFLIATPGRLIEMIKREEIGLSLCKFLVLDEADRMLDMGFEPQIRKILDTKDMPKVGERQTMMFSSTFPHHIQRLAREFLENFIFLTVGRVGSVSDNITQEVIWVEDRHKKNCLLDILSCNTNEQTPSRENLTLIFVETKTGADILHNFLDRYSFKVSCIHGNKTQIERECALKMFRNGENSIMIATAVASRGLDIPNVMHVINYELPSCIDEYVHRIGRSGRAGNVGKATSFFNKKNNHLKKDMQKLLMEAKQEVPSFLK